MLCNKQTKRNLTVLLIAMAVLASVLSGSVWAAGTYNGGDGSAGNPFQINTPAQMDEVGQHSEDWGSYFIVTADIDLAGYTGTQFNIIASDTDSGTAGHQGTKFTGFFDGNGHTISNFTYTSTGTHYIGLFGGVGGGGEIKDLGMTNVNVDAGTGDYVGGLVGMNYDGTVSNSYATGIVGGGYRVGGLLGTNYNGTVSNCQAAGNVSGVNWVGGLVGYNSYASNSTISNCYATGSVSGTGNGVGGLVLCKN